MASTIETSVRRALQEGNADDPDFRVQVYEAAERAIQRIVVEKGVGQDAADRQLEQLIAAIERIEADYPPEGFATAGVSEMDEPDREPLPAGLDTRADDAEGPVLRTPPLRDDLPEPDVNRIEDPQPAETPPVRDMPEPLREARVPDAPGEPDRLSPAGDWSPGGSKPSAPPSGRVSRWLVGLVAAILLLVLFALGAWWFSSSVLQTPQAEPEGMTVDEAIRAASQEDGESAEDWIGIFSGSEIANVRAVEGGRVAAEQTTAGRSAVRMEVPSVGGGTEISLVVGPGVVRSLGGQTVRGELTVGSPDGAPREFSVRCLFAGETTCGRQRFATSIAEETFVFDMEIPAGRAEEGQLAIDPGVGQESRDLLVFAFRLRPAG